jgi:hypothetical protein
MLTSVKKEIHGVIKLRREPYDFYVLVELPDGSSEDISGENLVDYLKTLGIHDPDRVADRVWNFYKVDVKL